MAHAGASRVARRVSEGRERRDRNGVAELAHQYAQICDEEARAPLLRHSAWPVPMEAKALVHVANACPLPFRESGHPVGYEFELACRSDISGFVIQGIGRAGSPG